MAKSLGLEVIAEGVECEAQERALLDLGCELGQGFYYDEALPPGLLARRFPGGMAGFTWPNRPAAP